MDFKFELALPKTVAIVGLSNKPDRPSYEVGLYLKNQGFTVIPVNPMVSKVFGLKSYPSISAIPRTTKIDIVDIFRRPDQVIQIVAEVIKSHRRVLIWMQEGVVSPEARTLAESNNLKVVMDKCIMKIHKASV